MILKASTQIFSLGRLQRRTDTSRRTSRHATTDFCESVYSKVLWKSTMAFIPFLPMQNLLPQARGNIQTLLLSKMAGTCDRYAWRMPSYPSICSMKLSSGWCFGKKMTWNPRFSQCSSSMDFVLGSQAPYIYI